MRMLCLNLFTGTLCCDSPIVGVIAEAVDKWFFQLLEKCSACAGGEEETVCFLLVWLCSQVRCCPTRMQRKGISMLFGLRQRWRLWLAFKCFPECPFHGIWLQKREQCSQRQVQAIIPKWSWVSVWLLGSMGLVQHRTKAIWTFCIYSSRLPLGYSIILRGSKSQGCLTWGRQATSLSSAA